LTVQAKSVLNPDIPLVARAMASGILASAQNSLPAELVLLIVEQLEDDKQALCTLARTCRALQHFAEEHIYKTIELYTVRDLHNIINAFTCRAERFRAVHALKLQYQYHEKDLDDSFDMRKTFNECIAEMPHLREWHIESPYDNCHWDKGLGPHQWVEGDMRRFRAALENACTEGPVEAERIQAERRLGKEIERTVGLALLESLTIHSHGEDSDFWDLGDFHCLFRHPTLRHLHISCVSLTEALPALQSHTRATPLTTLVFDECELTTASLTDILRVPAKLKHLTLGENVWNTRRSKRIQPRLNKNATASLEALEHVKHSLESLTHWDPSWKLDFDTHKARRISPPGDGMREFHALKFLQCETTSFLHQAIIMNHEVAPPNLETLRLVRHWNETVDFFEHLPEVEPYLALPSLTTLELMQSSYCMHRLSTEDYICDPEYIRARHAFAFKLHQAGINLKVLIEMHSAPNLIPPYLYGEETPIIEWVYNAEEIGFSLREPAFEDVTDGTKEEDNIGGHEAPPMRSWKEPSPLNEYVPQTDKLSDSRIALLKSQTRHVLSRLKSRFNRRPPSTMDDYEDPFEFEMDTDEEFDEDYMDFEVDDDDMNVIFHEHNGQLYVEIYESETEEEDSDDEDVEEEAEGAPAANGANEELD
jgi:hypothetical protein